MLAKIFLALGREGIELTIPPPLFADEEECAGDADALDPKALEIALVSDEEEEEVKEPSGPLVATERFVFPVTRLVVVAVAAEPSGPLVAVVRPISPFGEEVVDAVRPPLLVTPTVSVFPVGDTILIQVSPPQPEL